MLSAGKYSGGASNGAAHRPSELQRAIAREVLRVLEIAHIVHRSHYRDVAAYRGGVLHVEHVGPIFADAMG